MHKIDIDELTNKVSKDDFISYFLTHSRDDLMKHFGISRSEYTLLKSFYNVQKSKDDISKTRKSTCISKYGVESPMQIPEIAEKVSSQIDYKSARDKAKRTCIDRYGVDSFSKTEEFSKKLHDSYLDLEDKVSSAADKQKDTNMRLYGVDCALKSKVVIEKAEKTNIDRYNSKLYINSDDFKNKSKETNLQRYGVEHFSQTPLFIESIVNKSMEKYGVRFPQQLDSVKEKAKHTNEEKYGVPYYTRTEQYRDSYVNTCLERYGVEHFSKSISFKNKFTNTCMDRYGVEYPAQSNEVQSKSGVNRKRTNIASDGELLDSSYELDVYEYCIRNSIPIKRNIPIKYTYNGDRVTYIDFEIDGILCEVKGTHILKGCFDSIGVPISIKLDVYRKNRVVVISEYGDLFGRPNTEGHNGFNYSDISLIGIDIDLFRDPSFPYDQNKPKCFYDVKVMGCKSSFEAFNDEKIRWKMIKNRILYTGGFIDSKQILTALNVTRTCKQPSWFSKNFAKYIINKYVTTDTIVDPFAGWGMRHDASIELGKDYIGGDLNNELVEWHNSKGRNITLCDANDFRFTSPCSVFICPPYQGVERYFDTQDVSTTQCEWLKIVMNNVPNALEYIMVCKVVDDGWDRFVVEKKINKSHFGMNTEYIIVVKNSERNDLLSVNP